jgi:hypothetical protein
LAAVGVILAAYVDRQARKPGDEELKAVKAELDGRDPRWRLEDVLSDRAAVPEKDNSAPHIRSVYERLPKNLNSMVFFESARKSELPALPDAADVKELRDFLDANRAAVESARNLADYPRGRFSVDFLPNTLATRLPHLDAIRGLAVCLCADAILRATDEDGDGALRTSHALINVTNALASEPTLISQLVRIAGGIVACSDIERTLALTQPSEKVLAEMQRVLEMTEATQPCRVAMRGERAAFDFLWDNLAAGRVSPTELNMNLGVYGWFVFRYYFAHEQAGFLQDMTTFLRALDLPTQDQAEEIDRVANRAKNSGRIWYLFLPALNKVNASEIRWRAMIRSTVVALAAERRRRHSGQMPSSISELVPAYLSAVPLDPFTGESLRLRADQAQWTVYSVGPDLKDDRGFHERSRIADPDTDIGFTVWSISRRRQPPPAEEKQP